MDIKGIGFYTLGPIRKNLSTDQKNTYIELFEDYFLKTFSSRLAEYTNPEIDVMNKEVLNENYTIVNSVLKGTSGSIALRFTRLEKNKIMIKKNLFFFI